MNNNSFEDFKKNISTEADVYSIFSDLDIKKSGEGWIAHCPFHNDKTPSFRINIKDSVIVYHCFGCKESGDVFTYISKRNNLDISNDFKQIVEIVSNITNNPLPDNIFNNREKSEEELIFEEYHKSLLNTKNALKHLEKRGIKNLSIFGYDKKSKIYKIISRHLNKYSIIDYNPEGNPKYNFPSGFKKHIPFNLYNVRNGDIWLVEGIFDALYLYGQHNINAVALLGSELQNNTIKLLRRYDNIILALDNDNAGKEGTKRAVSKLYSSGFTNVFYLDYIKFEYKDINDAYQHDEIDLIKNIIKHNKKYAYKFIIEEHLKNRLNVNDDLGEIKEIDKFLKEIVNYKELIQNTILKIYKEKTGVDIKAQFELYKNHLITENTYSEIKSIIDSSTNFTIDKLEEVKKVTESAFSSITTIEIYKTPDIVNLEMPNKIKSSLIDDISYYESALSFVGARTGHRKTSLMINEAINLLSNHKVAFISLEEPFNWIGAKLIVTCYNKHNSNVKINLTEFFKNKTKYSDSVDNLTQNLFILDKTHYIEDLQKYIIHLHTHYNIKVFFIDYLQRISFKYTQMSRLNRQEQVKKINTILLDLAKENSLYIISGVQLNRTVTKEEDIRTDSAYREAGDIEQDANLLINLWVNKETNQLKYFIAKNRNGKSGFEGILTVEPEYWILENNITSSINFGLNGVNDEY